MPSPYVRRRRFAAELRKLREERGMTAEELGQVLFHSRTKITRLENAQVRPNVAEIMDLLERLDVTGNRYDKMLRLARDAAAKGWWDRYSSSMGPRQRLYADLECGAKSIRSYNQTCIPGLLQTPEFIAALVELDRCQGPLTYRPDRMTDARLRRQQELLREDGPSYEAVLDEYVLHRLAIPAQVMAAQLKYMIQLVSEHERLTLRVLPYEARIPGGLLPQVSFHLFTYPDPGDTPLAVIDTVTTDLILSKRREIARYIEVHNRLREAALSCSASLAYLGQAADRLINKTGSGA
jgi:transcriptional regulator with XRE-family HTH domain